MVPQKATTSNPRPGGGTPDPCPPLPAPTTGTGPTAPGTATASRGAKPAYTPISAPTPAHRPQQHRGRAGTQGDQLPVWSKPCLTLFESEGVKKRSKFFLVVKPSTFLLSLFRVSLFTGKLSLPLFQVSALPGPISDCWRTPEAGALPSQYSDGPGASSPLPGHARRLAWGPVALRRKYVYYSG